MYPFGPRAEDAQGPCDEVPVLESTLSPYKSGITKQLTTAHESISCSDLNAENLQTIEKPNSLNVLVQTLISFDGWQRQASVLENGASNRGRFKNKKDKRLSSRLFVRASGLVSGTYEVRMKNLTT